jgi:hypothetical protein
MPCCKKQPRDSKALKNRKFINSFDVNFTIVTLSKRGEKEEKEKMDQPQQGDFSRGFVSVLLVIAIILSVVSTWIALTSVQNVVITGEEKDTANVRLNIQGPQAPPQPTSDSGRVRLVIAAK